MLLAVGSASRLAGKKEIDFETLAKERMIRCAHCETATAFDTLLKQRQIEAGAGHRVALHQDLTVLLEANLGVGVVPQSFPHSDKITRLPIAGADLTRTISCYAVAGRQRSQAAITLIKMVRAADWPMLLAAQRGAAPSAAKS
jgi:DNA-binding transcriptional LysR family regulator